MKESLLLINDVTGYGRVSTFSMLPILTKYGLHPYVLPTALVSNTLDYGSAEILDTSEFMENSIKKWDELGFKFSCIATGFITNSKQVDIISDLIDKQDEPLIFVDPIMADDGKLYPGMYEGAVECNRKLASRADVMLPNLTEAKLLTGLYEDKDELTLEEYKNLVIGLLKLGPANLVIKGCKDESGNDFNLVYDAHYQSMMQVPYERIDASFIGTGDIFSAVLISEYLKGNSLPSSVNEAAKFVRAVIEDNINAEDHFDIHFEHLLDNLNRR